MHLSRRTAQVVLLLVCFITPIRADENTFRVGFAERDVTPEIGMEAPGGYGKAIHDKLHDPCKVRAAVFDDGTQTVALVGIDAIGIRRETVLKVRSIIREKTGIDENAILIGASHSHSSGPVAWIMPGEFDHASPLVQELAYKKSTCVDPKYLAHFENQLVDAVVAAHRDRGLVKAGIGTGLESQVAFNRRFKMRDGRTVTHPGLGNPEIVEPAGPTDPQVGVIGCWAPSDPNRLLGCVVHFTCHATTNPGGISANYVYYLEKVIQGYYGKDCVVVFLNGASGDITQVDNQSPYQYPNGEKWAQHLGGRVGAEALKVLFSMEAGTLPPVAYRTKTWMSDRRIPSKATIEKANALIRKPADQVDATDWTFAKETLLLESLIEKQPKVEVEVQAVQIGPAVFVTDPAEYFCQFGLEIKAGSGFPITFPVSLANGCVGYVPTEDAMGKGGGGYETRLTSYSNLEVSAGTKMRDVGIELARQLKPGAIPQAPKRLPFTGTIWPYGNAGPELE